MINPDADWAWPSFAQLRSILVNRLHCRIDPPPQNLIYRGARPVTVFVRRNEKGEEFDWIAFHLDDELLSRGIVLNACRNLRITLEALALGDPPSL